MMNLSEYQKIYDIILSGNINIITDVNFQLNITNDAINLINKQQWSQEDQLIADAILKISNTAYNNTTLDTLPLDDGIYDQLLQCYKAYNPNYQIGALPVKYQEAAQNEYEENPIVIVSISDKEIDSKLYIKDIWKQHTNSDPRLQTAILRVREPITKRLINTKHSYPELVGTLDKCKFTLNCDAIEKDVFNKPSVQVFERDFIQKHLQMGIINPTMEFEMVGELKYDGVSVEAEVCGDTIISARSRGDTGEDIATDLTPIFGGYKFRNAVNVPKDVKFGIKFEAVITKYDLQRLSELRGKSYKNCRNAIIGLLGASDAYKYVDFITLIPLSTSFDIPRNVELDFLNKYYSSGQYNRHVFFKGNYYSILFQVKQFVESAEIIRKVLPYLIDGVVISYTDPVIIKQLGRVNSVNKYSIAIKFNPRKVRTIFLGYTFSIGKSGDIIPMVHFKPCEFMGNIQTKQTLHSYNRFMELQLCKGMQIDIEYRNDVLSYVSKPDTEYNRNIAANEKPEPFIDVCPYCGGKIVISDSGKSAKCVNPECHERKVMRMVDMLSNLGFKDFSEESIRALNITSFTDLMNMTYDRALVLGAVNAKNFMDRLNALKTNSIPDYKILTALSFSNIGAEKWKIILKEVSIEDLVNMNYDDLIHKLIMPTIGVKTAETICNDRILYKEDLETILKMHNITSSKGLIDKPKIAFTGVRDKTFIDLLNNNGFDADENYSVTKKTFALITDNLASTSSKMVKAQKFSIPIFTKQQFLDKYNIKI